MSLAVPLAETPKASFFRKASIAVFCLGLIGVVLDLAWVATGNPWDNQGYMTLVEQAVFILCRNIDHSVELIFPAALLAAFLRGVAVFRWGVTPLDIRVVANIALSIMALGLIVSTARLFDGIWKHGPETMNMSAGDAVLFWVRLNAPTLLPNLIFSVGPALTLWLIVRRAAADLLRSKGVEQ